MLPMQQTRADRTEYEIVDEPEYVYAETWGQRSMQSGGKYEAEIHEYCEKQQSGSEPLNPVYLPHDFRTTGLNKQYLQ